MTAECAYCGKRLTIVRNQRVTRKHKCVPLGLMLRRSDLMVHGPVKKGTEKP